MPHIYMIAGPNGAGKTSAAMTLLPDFLHVNQFVNADEIARGLSPFSPSSVALEAGKIMLKRIDALLHSQESFAFETTASAHVHVRILKKAKALGYQTHLIFLYLCSPDLAIERVKIRVSQGGHNVEEEDVVRRYHLGLQRLVSEYLECVDEVEIRDNSFGEVKLVAEKFKEGEWNILQPDIWGRLLEYKNDKK